MTTCDHCGEDLEGYGTQLSGDAGYVCEECADRYRSKWEPIKPAGGTHSLAGETYEQFLKRRK